MSNESTQAFWVRFCHRNGIADADVVAQGRAVIAGAPAFWETANMWDLVRHLQAQTGRRLMCDAARFTGPISVRFAKPINEDR